MRWITSEIAERRVGTGPPVRLRGLIQKSGPVEIANVDRGSFYGVRLDLITRLQRHDGETALALWQGCGRYSFGAAATSVEKIDVG
jgi:hypothetical protein